MGYGTIDVFHGQYSKSGDTKGGAKGVPNGIPS